MVIWNPDNIFELELAAQLDVALFDNAEVINGLPTYDIKTDTRTKIVIKQWFHWAGSTKAVENLSWADLIIIYTGELINGPWDRYYKKVVDQYNNKNFVSIANGTFELTDYPTHLVYDDLGHFFSRIVSCCQFQEWNTLEHKPKLFDALLGIAKPHRIFIFDQLLGNGLLDKSFVSIHGDLNYKSPDLETYDDPKITDYDRIHSMRPAIGMANGISHSIPLQIYQHSWYSIVAETNPSGTNFLTEKTAKPLFSKKLFVLFGSQGLLEKLHNQGYQTFHSIIDESYDQEPDDVTRWSMAFEQVLALAKLDHVEVYKKIDPILVNNHNHICNHHYRLNSLKNFLTTRVLDVIIK